MTPEGWSEKFLGDFASLSAAPAKQSGGSRYVIVDMGSVAKDGSLLTHKKTDAKDDLLEVGDLVMPKDDIGGGQIIGKAIHIDAPNQYVLGDHVYRLRLSQGHPPYVRYAINSHQVNSSLRSKVVGSAQLGLGRRSVLEQPIPFPPLGEQQAIAEALSDADALVESLDALIAKKRDMKQAAMQQLLTGRTRLLIGSAEWEFVKVGEIARTLKGRGLSRDAVLETGAHPCLLYGELFTTYKRVARGVGGRTNSLDGEPSNFGDVLIPGSTTTSGEDLATATALLMAGVRLGGDVNIIRPDLQRIDPRWMAYVFTHCHRQDVALRAQGVTIHHLYGRDIASIEMRLPERDEQTALADVLEDMDAEIDALVSRREKADLMKQGMMQELLSGRVRLV